MNAPEYIVVDELGAVAAKVKDNLGLAALNYQYGYIKELNETLQQWAKNSTTAPLKFPLVYVEQPFNVNRGSTAAFFGTIDVIRIFIIKDTRPNWKAKERMDNNFKPLILPIYRQLLVELDMSTAFHTQGVERIQHTVQDRYYWGEAQASVLDDAVDCAIVTIRNLQVANNPNCIPTTSM